MHGMASHSHELAEGVGSNSALNFSERKAHLLRRRIQAAASILSPICTRPPRSRGPRHHSGLLEACAVE